MMSLALAFEHEFVGFERVMGYDNGLGSHPSHETLETFFERHSMSLLQVLVCDFDTTFVCLSVCVYSNIHFKGRPIGFDSTNVPYITVGGTIFDVSEEFIVGNDMIEGS